MAATFLLLGVLVQSAVAMTARSAAGAALSAAARRAAIPGVDLTAEAQRLDAALRATVPGAAGVEASVRHEANRAVAAATIEWIPPGIVVAPIEFELRREAVDAVPP